MKIHDFKTRKQHAQKISVLTCYDYPSAKTIAQTSLDAILVGDSVAMVVHGHPNTMMASMEMMTLHTQAVARGLGQQFLISDLPFLCHRASFADTLSNVKQLLQAGAHAVKIEGGDAQVCQTISALVTAGVPVMGHIGLTPQSILQWGGYKIQGKEDKQAAEILEQARQLEMAGCFALVIECVPRKLAKDITDALTIPTIGIGAGVDTDGQVLVWHDMLGLQTDFHPRFIKQFDLSQERMQAAIQMYDQHVKTGQFPTEKESF